MAPMPMRLVRKAAALVMRSPLTQGIPWSSEIQPRLSSSPSLSRVRMVPFGLRMQDGHRSRGGVFAGLKVEEVGPTAFDFPYLDPVSSEGLQCLPIYGAGDALGAQAAFQLGRQADAHRCGEMHQPFLSHG